MIPISDDNPTLRTPVVTIALLVALGAVWVFAQGAGFDPQVLAASVCNWGMVPGEITGRARIGSGVPLGQGMACLVDADPRNILTPVTSMFLHGGWGHLLGNALFLWVFGNNIEDSMGRLRFLVFYLVCGLAAAATQVAVDPGSVVPMVGASGAISGVLGAYLVLYPRVKVKVLFFLFSLHQGHSGAGMDDVALVDRDAGAGGFAAGLVGGAPGVSRRRGLGAHRRLRRGCRPDQTVREPATGRRADVRAWGAGLG